MSLCMRKPLICIGINKVADQLCSNCTADQRFCFRIAFVCDCTVRFVSDLVGNPNRWFSHAQAQIIVTFSEIFGLVEVRR